MDLKRLIAVARGDSPADLLFTNGRVVNTFTGEIEEVNIAVAEGQGLSIIRQSLRKHLRYSYLHVVR